MIDDTDPLAPYIRDCGCPHPHPLCVCFEPGHTPESLAHRSKWFSELAGALNHPPTNADYHHVMRHFGPNPEPIPNADLPPSLGHLSSIPLAGDMVEAIAKRIGADRLAKWWEAATGVPCGCEERKAKLNAATERLVKWVERYRGG